jgi:hypothetical protein
MHLHLKNIISTFREVRLFCAFPCNDVIAFLKMATPFFLPILIDQSIPIYIFVLFVIFALMGLQILIFKSENKVVAKFHF